MSKSFTTESAAGPNTLLYLQGGYHFYMMAPVHTTGDKT
ncbi:hypothetical protein CLV59_10968 [Chitinophaga dinghuensis]|uniref:Uncharacterized protein n=1 Tax=Chitinophaga dinghuensis TaxID=1539050 RepID=A0A327VL40_9BACT|nr:hypothetical protein CLV59_10968 [Chitinophaga dinghuensis]